MSHDANVAKLEAARAKVHEANVAKVKAARVKAQKLRSTYARSTPWILHPRYGFRSLRLYPRVTLEVDTTGEWGEIPHNILGDVVLSVTADRPFEVSIHVTFTGMVSKPMDDGKHVVDFPHGLPVFLMAHAAIRCTALPDEEGDAHSRGVPHVTLVTEVVPIGDQRRLCEAQRVRFVFNGYGFTCSDGFCCSDVLVRRDPNCIVTADPSFPEFIPVITCDNVEQINKDLWGKFACLGSSNTNCLVCAFGILGNGMFQSGLHDLVWDAPRSYVDPDGYFHSKRYFPRIKMTRTLEDAFEKGFAAATIETTLLIESDQDFEVQLFPPDATTKPEFTFPAVPAAKGGFVFDCFGGKGIPPYHATGCRVEVYSKTKSTVTFTQEVMPMEVNAKFKIRFVRFTDNGALIGE